MAITTIAFGVLRGLTGGQLLGHWGILYAWTWIAALLLGLALLAFGLWAITPAVEKLQKTSPGAEFDKAPASIKKMASSEPVGFLIMLGFMAAMRFGYRAMR